MNWFKSFWKRLTSPPLDKPRVVVQNQRTAPPQEPETPSDDERIGTFTPRALQVLALARKEAERLNHNFVGTEHLLLGLIAFEKGVAVNVLRSRGIELESVRAEVEKEVGTGPPDQKAIGNIPFTPRTKQALSFASKEARALNHTYVGTEHILLGLLRQGDGVAARVLRQLGLEIEKTREEILKELDPNFQPGTDATRPPASATSPASPARAVRLQLEGEPVDTTRRYDVSCTDWSQGVTVYPNVRFKSVKHLFQRSQYDVLSGYVELEMETGETIFVSRGSIIKFCEHIATPKPGV